MWGIDICHKVAKINETASFSTLGYTLYRKETSNVHVYGMYAHKDPTQLSEAPSIANESQPDQPQVRLGQAS